MGDAVVLDRPVMAAREAARQLRMPPSTLVHWLEGGERGGRRYEPVLREEPTGSATITWGEMVEARYVRAYRDVKVSMQRLRPFIAALREEFGVPYPLAHFRPYIDTNRRLIIELQKDSHLPEELWLVYEPRSKQYMINAYLRRDFLDQVEFEQSGIQAAFRMRPAGAASPVVMDPRIASAAATIEGIRTEILAEQAQADATIDEIADDFGLTDQQVKAALAYEFSPAA
ncbi:DUF433 domain-containing protein [Phytoactinopolyspora mesophila]|uniref:DUF433 domain-containing protein n=1 Tax=Phytoactinopolyspora mesophila TaxID=2650750 RepID=A0A7K3M5V3_9ACTN|nr:DUF433 domain-containing protein [Phytoactinopolyspora mesophila]